MKEIQKKITASQAVREDLSRVPKLILKTEKVKICRILNTLPTKFLTHDTLPFSNIRTYIFISGIYSYREKASNFRSKTFPSTAPSNNVCLCRMSLAYNQCVS